MGAIDWRRGVQYRRHVSREARITSFLSGTGKVVAILKIFELVLQQHEVGVEEQIFIRKIRLVIDYRPVPRSLLRRGEGRSGIFHCLQFQRGSRTALLWDTGRHSALLGLVVQRVVKINPESTVEF